MEAFARALSAALEPTLTDRVRVPRVCSLLSLAAMRASGKKAKAPAKPRAAPKPAAAPAVMRSSGRVATQPRKNYRAEKIIFGSDDEGESDDDKEEEDDAEVDDDDSDDDEDEEGVDEGDEGVGGGRKAKAKGGGKKKLKASSAKAKEEGVATTKRRVSRGAKASVVPGGRGFKCPKDGCDTFFDVSAARRSNGDAYARCLSVCVASRVCVCRRPRRRLSTARSNAAS